MTAKELGEKPAFPYQDFGNGVHSVGGLTKREWLAARAMQGLLSNPDCAVTGAVLARECAFHADHLLAELAKEQT